MTEEWAQVPGFNAYQVSTSGRVRGHRGKLLRPTNQEGYDTIRMHVGGARFGATVSRLMLMAFVGHPPDSSYQAAHLDGDPRNNVLTNLVWATPVENNSHKVRHGTQVRGESANQAKLTDDDAREIKALIRHGESCASISRRYPVSADAVQKIKQGKNWDWLPD